MHVICIPTIFEFKNIKILIHTRDHTPAHIHAVSPEAEAKIEIENGYCFFSRGYTQKDLKKIINFVLENRKKLMEVWDEYHS